MWQSFAGGDNEDLQDYNMRDEPEFVPHLSGWRKALIYLKHDFACPKLFKDLCLVFFYCIVLLGSYNGICTPFLLLDEPAINYSNVTSIYGEM